MACTTNPMRVLVMAWILIATTTCLQAQQNASASSQRAVRVAMHNVNYHFQDRIMVHIARLSGALVPSQPSKPPVFDDKQSFVIAIDSAEIAITQENLTNLLND